MSGSRVVILQGSDIKKLENELVEVFNTRPEKPVSVTQSQSAVPVIGSRMGWENFITITLVFPE